MLFPSSLLITDCPFQSLTTSPRHLLLPVNRYILITGNLPFQINYIMVYTTQILFLENFSVFVALKRHHCMEMPQQYTQLVPAYYYFVSPPIFVGNSKWFYKYRLKSRRRELNKYTGSVTPINNRTLNTILFCLHYLFKSSLRCLISITKRLLPDS